MGRPPEGGRPIGGAAEGGASVFFVSAHLFFYIMNIYTYSLYIPYLYVLNIFHIFSLVWFVIYSASSFKSNFVIGRVVGGSHKGPNMGSYLLTE